MADDTGSYTGEVKVGGPADVRELEHLTITKVAVDEQMSNNAYLLRCKATGEQVLIDAAAEAGANQVSGPGLSSSNAEALYRQALGKAVAEARARAEVLAKAAGRSLGAITDIVEGTSAMPYYAERMQAADVASTPIVPGEQETSASISVTFTLR